MENLEMLMADQLDAIIRRLTSRIEVTSKLPRRKGRPSVRKLKKNLGLMRGIRAHFDNPK
jgi:hypothetical protein